MVAVMAIVFLSWPKGGLRHLLPPRRATFFLIIFWKGGSVWIKPSI